MREVEAAARHIGQLPPLPDVLPSFDDERIEKQEWPMLYFWYTDFDGMRQIPVATNGSHQQRLDDETDVLPGRSSIWVQYRQSGKVYQLKSKREGGGFTRRGLAAQIIKLYKEEADDDDRDFEGQKLGELIYNIHTGMFEPFIWSTMNF